MIKFEYKFNNTATKITVELSEESSLTEVLESFEAFLKASGYSFSGTLDLVEEKI